jgi:N utilization substance protein B
VTRRLARLVAVEVLYAADVRAEKGADVFSSRVEENGTIPDYAEHLVRAVDERRAEIDAILVRIAPGWRPDRMSAVDRNVLRVGVLELLEGDTPPAVVIDEAVEVAKHFSGQEAGRFVNGVLSGVLRELPGA